MGEPLILPAAESGATERAANVLRTGGLVALPTDTVYGLAAALDRPDALRRIFEVKGRPEARSLPVLLDGPDALSLISDDSAPELRRFAARFWPGPLTLAVPARPGLPEEVLGPGTTVGVRVPDHDAARALCAAVGGALAVTSANRSGEPPARTAREVFEQLGLGVDLILDGGRTPGGIASTVVGFRSGDVVIHRDGPIARVDVESAWREVAGGRPG
jgi:L-threonylcarbamoyladenylate synthase